MKKRLSIFLIFLIFQSFNCLYCQFIDDMLIGGEQQSPTKRDSLLSAFGGEKKQKATEPKAEKKEAVKQEFFYPFVSGELDTSGSCWYDDKVYLLVVKSTKKAVITVLPYGFRFYEGVMSARNGFEKKVRENKVDIICWGQSSAVANPRCYFFLEPQGSKEPYQIYIQKAIGDKVSDPILYTFRKVAGEQGVSSKTRYMGGNKEGTALPPSGRARLSNGQR